MSHTKKDFLVHGVKFSVGTGKSHAAREGVVNQIIQIRKRGALGVGVIAVPFHKLGAEYEAKLRAHPLVRADCLRVATWRGFRAADPANPDYHDANLPDEHKTKMCRNLDAVLDAQGHFLPVQTSACSHESSDVAGLPKLCQCVYFSSCSYQVQRELKADIWIVPHQLLFQEAPLNLGQIAFVIIDESPWKAGLGGVEGNETLLFISSLRDGDDSGHPIDSSDWIALERYRHKALSAIIGQGNGPITRYAMAKAGLTEKAALHARLIEFKRLIKMLPALPGLSAAQRKARLSYASGNRTCMNAVRFWEAIAALLSESGPEKSGWAQVVFEDTSKKREGAIRLRWRKEIRKDWQVPTLIIDALFQPELVRPFWPQLKVIAGAQAAAPHEQVWQVIDQAYSKGHLEPLSKEHEKRSEEQKKRDEKEAQRRLNNRRKVRAIICSASRAYAPGRVLVVIQKSVKEALQAMGTLPANVVLAHHNAIAGRDEWGDVSCLVVVGRTSPPPENVESMAMALTGAAVSPLSGWYPTNTQHRHLSDGTLMPCSADYHPDQVSEAIRWHIVVGEVIQIVGRGRGVNRTAANPLDVLVLTDVPLPIPLHAVLTEASVKPTAADLMLAEGGFAFSASRHAADAYPGLWSNHEAAKKAIAAAGRARGIFPLRDINSGRIPRALEDLPSVEYQRRGPGQHAARAQFDPLVVRNPEAELQALLGQLEKCGLGT